MLRPFYKHLLIFSIISISTSCVRNNLKNTINLSGNWNVFLDSMIIGYNNIPKKDLFLNKIILPGSLAKGGYGIKTIKAGTARLTPNYKYVGTAFYSREIKIPKQWKNKEISLFLERVLWESKVFVDGIEFDTKDALGTPHIHQLGKLIPGKHTLTIHVNNEMIHNIGVKGHSYTEHTQTLWNGIVGRMELIAKNTIDIQKIQIYGDYDKDLISIKFNIKGVIPKKSNLKFTFINIKTKTPVLSFTKVVCNYNKDRQRKITIPLNKKIAPWSEFTPNLYKLKIAILKENKTIALSQMSFGLRKISHNGTKIYINNIPTFLRGNLDNVHFPLTGYPSCNVKEWERIFQTYKEYGLNHVRFHSWCPPEAAFVAADRLGIYIQAEAGIWLDNWMHNTIGVGKDSIRDQFIREEMNRVVDTYGNHPSFIMFGIGNELGSADFNVIDKWIGELKQYDPRRFYAASTARRITKNYDYAVTHFIEGVGLVRGTIKPSTNWDYESVYSPNKIPIIAHEIGQWPVYPDWKEIKKYTGVLKARNFEFFREQARKNGIENQSRKFQLASGALNQLLYKYEIESFLRTPSCAGIQLLGINDYPGQGEALIGWLDAFWGSKNITTPKEFRKHFNSTVPLARFKKFVWTNDEILTVSTEISHHGREDLKNKTVLFKIKNESGTIIFSQKKSPITIQNGELTKIASYKFPLNSILKATKLTISSSIEETDFENSWNVWVFPKKTPTLDKNTILVTDSFNEATIKALKEGKSVLLNASNLGSKDTSVKFDFYSIYWSLTYFPGQGKTNIGLLVDDDNHAFSEFPTSFHSDWQWESISKNSKAFLLNNFPHEYRPIAQPVDDFHRNNKMGILFELKVGKGKLLVSGFDIQNDSLVASKQLKYSLLNYMNSEKFNPSTEVSSAKIASLFSLTSSNNYVEIPKEYKNPIIYIKASGNLKADTSLEWKKDNDKYLLLDKSDYTVKVKSQNNIGWVGNIITMIIDCPKGILGTLYVKIKDIKKLNKINFEGRIESSKKTGKDTLLKYHIMREDSQDGILKLHLEGKDIIIEELVIIKES